MKKTTSFFFFTLLFLIISYASLSGQKALTSVVIGEKGTPLEYCNVVGYSRDSTFLAGVVTDSTGKFILNKDEQMSYLQFSCIGYKPLLIPIDQLPSIVEMHLVSYTLKGVVVHGKRPNLKIDDHKLKLKVEGTLLAQKTNIERLLQEIPGLAVDQGVSLLGGGTLLVLVDNREIFSWEELRALDPKEIISLSLDRNPGSRYRGSVDAVLNIKTKHRLDHFSVRAKSSLHLRRVLSYDEDLLLGYSTKKSQISLQVNQGNERKIKKETINAEVKPYLDLRTQLTDTIGDAKGNLLFRANFIPSSQLKWGVGYHLSSSRIKNLGKDETRYLSNSDEWSNITSYNNTRNKASSHHINAYAEWQMSQKWRLELYADAFIKKFNRHQMTEENSGSSLKELQMTTGAHYALWQLSPYLSYAIGKGQMLVGGLDVYQIRGKRKQDLNETVTDDGANRESMLAGYATYSFPVNKWGGSIGIRFEHADSKLTSPLNPSSNIDRTYNDLFFTGKLSGAIGSTMHSLSLTSGTRRPSLEDLSNNSYYSNKFVSSNSNPNLSPAKNYRIGYDFIYSILYIGINYQYSVNHIDNYIQKKDDATSGYIISKANFDQHHRVQLMANARQTWSWYTLNIFGLVQMEHLDGKKYNLHIKQKPLLYARVTQIASIPKWFDVELNYTYQSPLTSGIFEAEDTHQLDIEIRKQFLGGRLDLSLLGVDLLKTVWDIGSTQIEGIRLYDKAYKDIRSISLQLRYYFNKKNLRQGKSTATESINRL